jgi:hypothetical protein
MITLGTFELTGHYVRCLWTDDGVIHRMCPQPVDKEILFIHSSDGVSTKSHAK